jgi:hypothetical protein
MKIEEDLHESLDKPQQVHIESTYTMAKIFKFNYDPSQEIPTTRTIKSFVKAMLLMHREGHETFTALDVINYALRKGIWSTTQATDDKRMTTWAFYQKKLMSYGLESCGETSEDGKKKITLAELLGEFADDFEEDANDEGFDEDHELDMMTRPETEDQVKSND